MSARYKRKFRNYFLKKNFQGRIGLAMFIGSIGVCSLFFALLALFSRDTLTFSYTDSVVAVGQTPWMILKNALAANWVFLLIGGTLIVVAAIISSHRVAGPLFRFEKALAEMADGDLSSDIHLREKDEGQELAASINTFNSVLSAKIKKIDRSTRAISDLIARCEALHHGNERLENTDEILKAIKSHNIKIKQQVDFFTRKDD